MIARYWEAQALAWIFVAIGAVGIVLIVLAWYAEERKWHKAVYRPNVRRA